MFTINLTRNFGRVKRLGENFEALPSELPGDGFAVHALNAEFSCEITAVRAQVYGNDAFDALHGLDFFADDALGYVQVGNGETRDFLQPWDAVFCIGERFAFFRFQKAMNGLANLFRHGMDARDVVAVQKEVVGAVQGHFVHGSKLALRGLWAGITPN